jgi:hypothetical protein
VVVVFTGVMSDSPQLPAWSRPGGAWGAGTVTSPGLLPAAPPPPVAAPPPDGPQRRRRQMMIFGGVAGVIAAAGLIVVLAVAFSGENPFRDRASAPSDVRPPLAQLCPAPTVQPSQGPRVRPPSAAAPKPGARTIDQEAGISYAAYPAPWEPWTTTWRAGTLEVPYRTGQHFVTEIYSGGIYHASILSAAVPAADNDAVSLNLDCVGRQVAADVRAEYYPQPNTMDAIKGETTMLGGRPAWLSIFRLHFTAQGLRATEELSAVAVIDVGKPTAAVLYVSIPGTHKQLDWVIDDVLASVRPI